MDNYKDTKEGRIVAAKYADILHLSRPEPSIRHPRMSVSNRAKIFSPFAALRGYEEEIAEDEYYSAAEPPVRYGESHLSGPTEPPIDSYSA